MEETKYYQPEIEEFHVGFEYDVRTKRYTSSTEFTTPWVPCVQGDSSTGYKFVLGEALLYKQDTVETLKTCIVEKGVRVKCLGQEDIESFGFKRDIEDSLGISYILNEELNIQLFLQGKHEPLCVCPCTDCNVTLMIISRGPAEEKGTTNLFVGYIKNKSELKRLLKQLEII